VSQRLLDLENKIVLKLGMVVAVTMLFVLLTMIRYIVKDLNIQTYVSRRLLDTNHYTTVWLLMATTIIMENSERIKINKIHIHISIFLWFVMDINLLTHVSRRLLDTQNTIVLMVMVVLFVLLSMIRYGEKDGNIQTYVKRRLMDIMKTNAMVMVVVVTTMWIVHIPIFL